MKPASSPAIVSPSRSRGCSPEWPWFAALLGTALLIAIAGEPATLAAADAAAGRAYLFAVAAGLAALALRPLPLREPVPLPA